MNNMAFNRFDKNRSSCHFEKVAVPLVLANGSSPSSLSSSLDECEAPGGKAAPSGDAYLNVPYEKCDRSGRISPLSSPLFQRKFQVMRSESFNDDQVDFSARFGSF